MLMQVPYSPERHYLTVRFGHIHGILRIGSLDSF